MSGGESLQVAGVAQTVLRSRSGRLFYETFPADGIDIADAARRPLFPRLADAWRRVLETRGRLLKKRGLRLYVLVCPEAHFIHREEVPDHLLLPAESPGAQFARLMSDIDNVTIVHPEARLLQARGGLDVYRANDTHWSTYGAFVAYRALIDALAPGTPMRPVRTAQIDYRSVRSFGDLGALVEPEMPLQAPVPQVRVGTTWDVWNRVDEQRNAWLRTASDHGRGRLFITRDSFATHMGAFLQHTFERVDWLGTTSRLFLEAIDEEKPDVVVWELGERRLHRIELDQYPTTAYETFAYDARSAAGKTALAACDHRDAGNLPRALVAANQALELSPDDGTLRYLLGTLHLRLGDGSAAQNAAQRAIAIRDDRPAYWQLLASALRLQGLANDALAASRTAASLSPDNAFYVAEFGADLLQQGDISQAVDVMSRCRQDVSTSKLLCCRLAEAWSCVGAADRAQAEAQQGLLLDPEDPLVQRLVARLGTPLNSPRGA